MDDEIFEKFYNSSLRFLSYRPRSEKEVRDNLRKKVAKVVEVEDVEKAIDGIITRLKEHKFIDDKEFAQWFVRSRNLTRPKAARIIKMELKQKGINQEIMEKAMNDKGLMINDLESAKKLLSKKLDKYKGFEKREIYKKLGGFLARRGFDWDTIKKSIDETFEKVV